MHRTVPAGKLLVVPSWSAAGPAGVWPYVIPLMAIEPVERPPLDYASPSAPGPIPRSRIVTAAGVAIALVGVIVFFSAHAISTPERGVSYNPDERRLHELLWGAFGHRVASRRRALRRSRFAGLVSRRRGITPALQRTSRAKRSL
jgi:hypothetical protein